MLTLRELKNMADVPKPGQKTPTAKELRSSDGLIADRALQGDAWISAYKSGYAVYSVCGSATVFRIHACGSYCYDSGKNTYDVDSGLFDGESWHLRLVLEGEDRLCRNREAREQMRSVLYSNVSEEWGILRAYEEPALERLVREEAAEDFLSALTERQKLAVRLFYLEQKTERQIAGELGITAPAVSRILAKSLKKMRQCGLCGKNTQPAAHHKEGRHARETAVRA